MISQGDTVRFLSTPLTKRMGLVGRYGEVLIGKAATGYAKILTPTRAGVMPFWFPLSSLKLCGKPDPRPPVNAIVMFLPTETNDTAGLTGETGIVIRNLPESAFCHVETAMHSDHCAHFTEIERIDV